MRSLVSHLSARTSALTAALVLCAVTFTYSNHFQNSFQFDDYHTVKNNAHIRYLGNIPGFFTDATSHSVDPRAHIWRPLVTTSLAIDYWLGGGLETTFYFHLSTFLWFLVLLVLMYLLYVRILEGVRPQPYNPWIAWFAVAWYGLHPAMAETVNYIIQRADLLSTLGVVAALLVYARFPQRRSSGLYLIPFVLGVLAKAPALVFPLLLLAYVFLFEESISVRGFRAAARKSVPAAAVACLLAFLSSAMTPKSFVPTKQPAYDYLITQPYVALRYFRSFFLPTHLSADTDLEAFPSVLRLEAIAGFLFVAALLWAIHATARRFNTRPISFGLVWFVLALAPTSLYPLAEVENDHRMFFPFVGLVFAVTWAGSLILLRRPLRGNLRWTAAAGLVCLLLLCALGTRERNEVWRTPESLWYDVMIKSPGNGRGFMNYGAALMNQGAAAMDKAAAQPALAYFERAAVLRPNDSEVEVNLGVVNGDLNRPAEAERHFQRAIQLDPKQAGPFFYYARWLNSRARADEAMGALNIALSLNPSLMDARYQLLQMYADHGLWNLLKPFGEECLKLAPNDPTILKYLGMEQQAAGRVAYAEAQSRTRPSPQKFLELSTLYHRMGRYQDCIAAAQEALRLRPDFAEAYNNIAAAYLSTGQWDQAIQAAGEALRLKPDVPFARANLEFAKSRKDLPASGSK
jgi:tetratricopeptide (TPR) repeat protein